MPEVIFYINPPVNFSFKEGDICHYITPNAFSGGFNTHTANTSMVTIGKCKKIQLIDNEGIIPNYSDTGVISDNITNSGGTDSNVDTVKITCDTSEVANPPSANDFIFFSKDRRVNENNATGYYGKFTFKNDSREKAELFTVACDISESSK